MHASQKQEGCVQSGSYGLLLYKLLGAYTWRTCVWSSVLCVGITNTLQCCKLPIGEHVW